MHELGTNLQMVTLFDFHNYLIWMRHKKCNFPYCSLNYEGHLYFSSFNNKIFFRNGRTQLNSISNLRTRFNMKYTKCIWLWATATNKLSFKFFL